MSKIWSMVVGVWTLALVEAACFGLIPAAITVAADCRTGRGGWLLVAALTAASFAISAIRSAADTRVFGYCRLVSTLRAVAADVTSARAVERRLAVAWTAAESVVPAAIRAVIDAAIAAWVLAGVGMLLPATFGLVVFAAAAVRATAIGRRRELRENQLVASESAAFAESDRDAIREVFTERHRLACRASDADAIAVASRGVAEVLAIATIAATAAPGTSPAAILAAVLYASRLANAADGLYVATLRGIAAWTAKQA